MLLTHLFAVLSLLDAAVRFVFEPNKSFFNLFKVASNNSIVQLLFDGTPEVKECYIDSKKDVDRYVFICHLVYPY